MRATVYPDINDETEGEEVPKAFIAETSDGPIPLKELDIKEINPATTEDFDSQSPVHVIIAGINPSNPDIIDAPTVIFPNTKHTPVQPELSIPHPLSTTVVEVLPGSEVPTIDIILNSAGIISIQQHTHSRGRIEMHFATTNTGYFLFSCLITRQLIKPVCDTPDEVMRVKNARRAFRKRSSVVWDDLYYGILSKDYEWSPLQRCEVFKALSRGERDGEYIPVVCPEVQPVWRWNLSMADCIVLFARVIVSMLELAIIVSLPALVVVGGTRFILLSRSFYKDIDGKALCAAR
ncbi:hypothetical protein V502_09538 [Pseudogymnoascus sp. VKM F-4520 (FW-2644)]|nr:hypothetical protein V502_09538 [Pseudogymnoascus sp. VKM F-4520 (FW-2644)]